MLLFARVAALALLALMGWLMFSGVRGDSVTFDEQPHVAAGYTYLTRRSLDFNVEHPPLVKDLAAFPLLFMKLDFSWDVPDWFNGDPWEFGRKLLDHSNDDPDGTMFAVRVPMILVTLLLGWLLFAWTSRHYGSLAAIIALVLYVFSPTILAHGRLVTTDVGAAAGFFIGLSAFLRFLQAPTGKNIFMAGGALGLALLAKFSTFLLVPVFVFLALAWGLLNRRAAPIASQVIPRTWGSPVRWTRGTLLLALPRFARPLHSAAPRAASAPRLSVARAAAVILLGFALVYLVYAHHMLNLPADRQMARTQVSLTGRGVGKTPKDVVLWMARKPALRPLAQYFSGMIQTLIRSTEGGGVYLLGRFYPLGVPQYFPLVYLMKEPAALHVLSLLAMFIAVLGVIGALRGKRGKLCDRLREHFAVLAMLLVVAAYWVFSIRSHLNIGIRHMMPVLPFTFVLVGTALARCRQAIPASLPRNLFLAAVIALLGWQAVSVLRVQPYHMAYFNEFAGGAENGWQRVIDSNADWGQDLGRVARFAEDKHISKLWLDYFGSADANRYLPGQWEAINLCSPPQKGWIAVSVMSYQNSASNPACDYRRWLPLEKLTTKVGYSTLIFYIE